MPEMTFLNYSPPPRLAWVSRWKRSLIVLAISLAVAVVGYRYEPQVQRHVEWLYWSYRCAEFKAPGNIEQHVYDPVKARQLLASNPDYVSEQGMAIYRPLVYRQLAKFDGRCNWIGGEDGTFYHAVAFIGSRTRPDGVSRLVIISGEMDNALDVLGLTDVLVLPRPHLFDATPKLVGGKGSAYSGRWEPIEVRAGIADPKDPSHITFAYTYGWRTDGPPIQGTMDAYLRNDDSIEFKTPLHLRRTNFSGVIPKEFIDGRFGYPFLF